MPPQFHSRDVSLANLGRSVGLDPTAVFSVVRGLVEICGMVELLLGGQSSSGNTYSTECDIGTSSSSGLSALYLAEPDLKIDVVSLLPFRPSKHMTIHAVTGSCLGGLRAISFSFLIPNLSFLATDAAFCKSVGCFLVLGFGLALGFAFALALVMALGFFAGGFLATAIFFATVVFGVVAGFAVGAAFFLGVVVVLPVWPLGLDTGRPSAKPRRAIPVMTFSFDRLSAS